MLSLFTLVEEEAILSTSADILPKRIKSYLQIYAIFFVCDDTDEFT